MNCREVRQELSAYIDGAIPEAMSAEISEHLKGCSECRAALEELRLTVSEIKSLDAVEPPDLLVVRVMARVTEEQRQRQKPEQRQHKGLFQRLFPQVRFAIPLTAVATVLVAAVTLYLFRDIHTQVKLVPQLPTRPAEERPVVPPQPLAPLQPKGKEVQMPEPARPAEPLPGAERQFAESPAQQFTEEKREAATRPESADNASANAPISVGRPQEGRGALPAPAGGLHSLRKASAGYDGGAAKERLDFYYSDGSGKSYRSTETAENERIVLIETPALNETLFERQKAVIDSVAAEARPIRMVVACRKKEYLEGFHTSKETAAQLSSDRAGFRVRLITGKGIVLIDSTNVLSRDKILANY